MNFLNYVNIKQGTASLPRFSNGNTLPLVQHPFGFAAFAPQTDSTRGTWFYHPCDRSFEGIRLTRQPSPWIGEQGAIVIMPQLGIPEVSPERRWSGFRPEDTVLMPHYMKYNVLRSRASIELTPTNSGACIRVITSEEKIPSFISVLPVDTPCFFEMCGSTLKGYTECKASDGNVKLYFVFEFKDGDISEIIIDNDTAKAYAHIRLSNKCTEIKLSTSLISCEQALLNMKREHTYTDFDSLKEQNKALWEQYLSRITINTENEEIKRTFYSCLYRAFLFPHKAYELDCDGQPIHFSASKKSVVKGYHYTDNGFWDTYRTVYSMLPLIARDEYERMIEGFVNDYTNDGWLPCWTATTSKKCMPSTMIDAVLSDAAKRSVLKGKMLETALEGMLKHANVSAGNLPFGRDGCEEYTKLGYVPNSYVESVNLTLDATYGDWCISEIAKILGKNDIAKEYAIRSKNYKNLFDPETGFMRSRDENGNMREEFSPEFWGRDYTEASAWQTSFAVQHDLDGLALLHGGRDNLLKKLDELFRKSPTYLVGGYGGEIHEMTEMASVDLGQCAISNQPSFHIPFIYAYFGEKAKTEEWVKKICTEVFSYRDDGFPGDEDNGSMACWYLFSVMGFYPLTPGDNSYVRFKGLVDMVKINGKDIDDII